MYTSSVQDAEEREECMLALSRLARSLDTSSLPRLQRLAAAFVRGVSRLQRAAPLEALAHTFLAALRARSAAAANGAPSTSAGTPTDGQASGADVADAVAFLHSRVVVLFEDVHPPAALRVLLGAAAALCRAGEAEPAGALLDCALAVYHRYCALPPHTVPCFMALLHAGAALRHLPVGRYGEFADTMARFATSLPVRDDRVRL